jgi:hypothetical protein
VAAGGTTKIIVVAIVLVSTGGGEAAPETRAPSASCWSRCDRGAARLLRPDV